MLAVRSTILSILLSLPVFGTVSPLGQVQVTRQQATIPFAVTNPVNCTLTAYYDSARTIKADDTNNSLFSGSEACNRSSNLVSGTLVTAVVGLRTSQVALDGKLHSRSLETAHTYYYTITDTSDSTVLPGSFTTANIPWGDTHIEDVPYSSAGFNHWAYPDLDWSDAGATKSYVDPITGISFQRGPRDLNGVSGLWGKGEAIAFAGALDTSGHWTNPANALNNSVAGPFASYANTGRDYLYLPFLNSRTQYAFNLDPYDLGKQLDDLQVNLYGYASSGSGDDVKVSVCLAVDYVNDGSCANGSTPIDVTLPSSAAALTAPSSFPFWQLAGWNIGKFLTIGQLSLPIGAATVSASSVTLTSGYLPPKAAVGMPIQINGVWYHIGTLGTATAFTLQESGITTTGNWQLGNFGLLIRKKTAVNNQINIAATWTPAWSGGPSIPFNGVRDFCSSLTFDVNYQADGATLLTPSVKGRMCFMQGSATLTSEAGWLFILLATGETRFLSPLRHYATDSPIVNPGAFSPTDPYTIYAYHAGVFYSVAYSPSCGHYGRWAGTNYNTYSYPSDCMTWTSLNSFGSPATQISTYFAANPNPVWDVSLGGWAPYSVAPGTGSHVWANMYIISAQDNGCFEALFDLGAGGQLVKAWDTISGSVAGLRWSACHEFGIDLVQYTDYGPQGMSNPYAKTNNGYLSGPYVLNGITAISTDGIVYTGNTSLNNAGRWISAPSTSCTLSGTVTPWMSPDGTLCVDLTNAQGYGPNAVAGNCGTNPYGVTGPQCVWFKTPSDTPCSYTANALELAKFPACPWHSGWSTIQTLQAGDYISRITSDDGTYNDPGGGGKREKFHILTKTSDGSGGWILMVQRWAACDNPVSDMNSFGGGNGPAVTFWNHMAIGQDVWPHNSMPNGWNAYMTGTASCSGETAWTHLSPALAATDWKANNDQFSVSHNTVGIGPNGTYTLMVGPGVAKYGPMPSVITSIPDKAFNTDSSSFNGLVRSSGGEVEAYPSLSNWTAPTVQGRSRYWDFRHINPDTGTLPEILTTPFGQTYALVSGQHFTYLVNSYQDLGDFKSRPPNVFSAAGAFKNISSPATGNLIDDTQPWTRCQAYKANECRTGSSAGNIYVVAPNANTGTASCSADTYQTYSPCVTPLWSHAGWMVEGDARTDDPLGIRYSRLTMGLSGPAIQYQYTSPHMVSDSSFAFLRAGVPNGVRPDPLLIRIPPTAPFDSIDRTRFVPLTITLPAGSGYGRVRFGYAENGTASQYYCTGRQEACLTDASVAPFAWASSDSLTAASCAAGCTLTVPGLSGRILYYSIETCTTSAGTTCSAADPQVWAVP